jgi:tetratricopeptide (TPR) repeat protein
VPDNIAADQLDPEALSELRTLPGDLADAVARYLVATGLQEEPERAYEYAKAARGLAARVGIVRETCAIAAYQAGHWSDALAEFRAARRLTGRDSYLPLMADCERALGRLDRALDIVSGPEARSAERATQVELRIVESGIRRDQGLADAGVVALQIPELTDKRGRAGRARLFYAYADALLDADREEEARDWFRKAAAADTAGETDAAERLDELDEVLIEDLDDEDLDETTDDEDLAETTDDEDLDDEDLDDEDLAETTDEDPAETTDDEDLDDEDLAELDDEDLTELGGVNDTAEHRTEVGGAEASDDAAGPAEPLHEADEAAGPPVIAEASDGDSDGELERDETEPDAVAPGAVAAETSDPETSDAQARPTEASTDADDS